MLALFGLAFSCSFVLAASPAFANDAAELVVGSVRDERGVPVSGADVAAFDGSGRRAGGDRSDALGTFVVSLLQPAVALEIRCSHCRPTHVALRDANENVAIVVRRYAALESDVPDATDLAALPYGAPIDVLGLVPFMLPSGTSISDRGLGGGRGLVVDDGAPLVDLSLGTTALFDFPDRYVRSIGVAGPEVAYRYGVDAGGGVFFLGPARFRGHVGIIRCGSSVVARARAGRRQFLPGSRRF